MQNPAKALWHEVNLQVTAFRMAKLARREDVLSRIAAQEKPGEYDAMYAKTYPTRTLAGMKSKIKRDYSELDVARIEKKIANQVRVRQIASRVLRKLPKSLSK